VPDVTPTATVLVVDDDRETREAVRDVLTDAKLSVVEAATGREATERVEAEPPDLVLLDLGLPDMAGLDVLVELTQSRSVPVIVLSGRGGEIDRVVGLDLGADDYIVKPYSARELLARVRVAIRRSQHRLQVPELTFDGLAINCATRDVVVDGRAVDLTAKEFDLLTFLASTPRQVYSRAQLLETVWASSPVWQDDGTVAEHVYRIRRKLDEHDRHRFIETVKGVGYRFAPQ
jgi:two-component system phosphate regulon response regulator PhoB